MTIRGRIWIRKHDVYHLSIQTQVGVKAFHRLIGFRIPAKARKLADFVRMIEMSPGERYTWFRVRYEKKGRKWARKEEVSSF